MIKQILNLKQLNHLGLLAGNRIIQEYLIGVNVLDELPITVCNEVNSEGILFVFGVEHGQHLESIIEPEQTDRLAVVVQHHIVHSGLGIHILKQQFLVQGVVDQEFVYVFFYF